MMISTLMSFILRGITIFPLLDKIKIPHYFYPIWQSDLFFFLYFKSFPAVVFYYLVHFFQRFTISKDAKFIGESLFETQKPYIDTKNTCEWVCCFDNYKLLFGHACRLSGFLFYKFCILLRSYYKPKMQNLISRS